MSPSRKRAAVNALQAKFTVSERRACQVIDQPRSSQRYRAQPRDDERALVKRMLERARERPRFDYRRIAALLRRENWRASAGRVYRLWRREGLKVPQRPRNAAISERARTPVTNVRPHTATTFGAGTSCSTGRRAAER